MAKERIEINVTWPVGTLLTLIFIVLKLTGTINWSWWWVLSPIWITISIALLVILVIFLIANYDYRRKWKDR